MRTRPLNFLWQYVTQHKLGFSGMFACLMVWAIDEALFPYFIKLFVDCVELNKPDTASLWHIFKLPILGMGITFVVMQISMRVFDIIEMNLMPRFRARIRQDIFDHIKDHSFKFFSNSLAGSLGTKVQDVSKSSQYIVEHFMWNIIARISTFIFAVGVVIANNYLFGLIMVIWCGLHFLLTFWMMPGILAKTDDHYQSLARLSGETIDVFNNILSVKFFGRTFHETSRINQVYQSDEITLSKQVSLQLLKLKTCYSINTCIFLAAIIYFLLTGWRAGTVSIGDFPLITMTSFNIMLLIWEISFNLVDMTRDIGTLQGALDAFVIPHDVKDKPNALPIVITRGSIEFDTITFGYHKTGPLFQNLSLTIEPGEKIGLVGFSGSGKTSLINLILRGYDVSQGTIKIDGQDISAVQQESLRAQITTVPQDSSLFHRSILENIRYGCLDASYDQVIAAAKQAHCHDFIVGLSEGYDTIVGERGSKLSGGQRQRLSIARAFLKNSMILILDEATSALDTNTELLIHESLNALMENKTVLAIAHRLSTLRSMTRILVFDKGCLIEDGRPDVLLGYDSYFKRMWNLNQDGFIPDHTGLS